LTITHDECASTKVYDANMKTRTNPAPPGASSTTPARTALRLMVLALCALGACGFAATIVGSEQRVPASTLPAFEGGKTAWHGFDRYDFQMDEESLAIQPIKAADDEKDGIKHNVNGQRRCVVVVPKAAAPGNPWSWQGCYWDHQPQTEVELLKRGFHIAYIESSATLKPGRQWEAWYAFLTEKHGFSKKPAFVGMSRGGEYAYTWATSHPDQVSCIYADNPGGNREILMKLGDLAQYDVPLLHVCGSIDPLLGKFSSTIENLYQQWGGRISVMIKEGGGHHPHSLRDPRPLADFIAQSVKPVSADPPGFLGERFTKTAFYSLENSYRDFPLERTYITCRGPLFTECYLRYAFNLAGAEGTINVIEPKAVAPGKPGVFRADYVARDALVDLALLARGFYIVTGPVPYNADGPQRAHWDAVYRHLVSHGFSRKPVMEGAGAAAGEAYAWAIENPDKVSCIYGENPVLRSNLAKTQPLDNLAPLAKAGVPLLHVCGSLDPWLNTQTRVVEKRYQELGGQITVIVKEGEEHYPTAPKDPKPVVDFITARTQ
jgi:pimeloyl-ACP methyl ester carboxylesterase